MFDTKEHTGGVVSRTAPRGIVSEPVVVTIGGAETELTLEDAKDLVAGLQSAISAVEANEATVRNTGHYLIYGRTRHGLSFIVPSKIGRNPTATDQRRIQALFKDAAESFGREAAAA